MLNPSSQDRFFIEIEKELGMVLTNASIKHISDGMFDGEPIPVDENILIFLCSELQGNNIYYKIKIADLENPDYDILTPFKAHIIKEIKARNA